jgi:TetR/AcrR family transcriptional regulator, cholesterol catabolism regulator
MADDLGLDVEVLSTSKRLTVSAASLFREKGFAGTTTRELSDAIGVQKSSLYYHIDSKEALLFDLCKSTLEDVCETIRLAFEIDASSKAKIEKLLTDYTTLILTDRDRHSTMLVEMRSLSPGHRQEVVLARDENVQLVREVVEAAQREGSLRSDISPKNLVLAFFNLLNWSIFWYDESGPMSTSEIAEFLRRIFFEGADAR